MKPSFLVFLSIAFLLFPASVHAQQAPFVHYEYTLRKGGLLHRHGLRVQISGRLVLTHAVENGTPRETPIGTDPAFARQVFEAATAPAPSPLPLLCGAPRMGRLTLQTGAEPPRTVDLAPPATARRWGHLLRLLERRLLPLHPEPVWEDCLSLLPPADVEVLQKPQDFEVLHKVSPPVSPRPFFLALLETEDDDEAAAQLGRIAWIRGADPFFAGELLLHHRYSDEAREYLLYNAAVPALFAQSGERVARLLEVYRKERGIEKKFYAAMLALAASDYDTAALEMQAYYRGIGRDKEASAVVERIQKAHAMLWLLNRGEATWVRQAMVMAFLFDFWWDMAQLLAEPDGRMPPLAERFYRNAYHFGRLFAADTRVGSVPATPRAREALARLTPLFAARPWWTLPAHTQQDIIAVLGTMSQQPQLFGGPARVREILPAADRRVYELARTRRFAAAGALLQKLGRNEQPAAFAALGRALSEEEEWPQAASALQQAQEEGNRDLAGKLAAARMEACRPMELGSDPEEIAAHAEWLLDAGEISQAKSLLATAAIPMTSWPRLRLGLLAGEREALLALRKAVSDGNAAARFLATEMALLRHAAPDEVYAYLASEFYGPHQARAFAYLALSAFRRDWKNADIFLGRAIEAAHARPEQMEDLLELLVRWGAWPDAAWELSQNARAIRPFSSRVAWARAVLLARSGDWTRALLESTFALSRRPCNPRFQKLQEALLQKLQ